MINFQFFFHPFRNRKTSGSSINLQRKLNNQELKAIRLYKLSIAKSIPYSTEDKCNDSNFPVLLILAKQYAMREMNKQKIIILKMTNRLCPCIHDASKQCLNFVATKLQLCSEHYYIAFFIMKAIGIPRCENFWTFPRCMREASHTDQLCRMCKSLNQLKRRRTRELNGQEFKPRSVRRYRTCLLS